MSSQLPSLHDPRRGLRTEYQSWLDTIDDELVGGALVVVDALPVVTRGFLRGDAASADVGRAVVGDVHDRCRRIEDESFLLLARESPVSGDLRRLVALLRLVSHLERSSTLLRHVGEAAERMDPRQLPVEVRSQLDALSAKTNEVFRLGVDAWRRRDALAVYELVRLDTDVDTLRTGLLLQAHRLERASRDVVLLGLLGRYFERLADHGVAFASQTTFAVTGERVGSGT